ncbi:hypothetical protein GLOIN_2v1824437 [Rhizophagus clarus]|uniref:Uncharacterized protein n=1 Tax=Rhizophagus clarus TaxID=94130 RepID=A0A8H3L113_9GLOM|nr:hypothetical protein GLOIN_2v1824437 [Rhizophagus clarus]
MDQIYNTDGFNNMDELNIYFDELDNMASTDEFNNTDDETGDELESYKDELSMNISRRYFNQFFSQYIQMNTVTNKYLGQDKKHTNSSYYEFLILHHEVIFISSLSFISSISFSNWKTFDDYWTLKFLDEVKNQD